MKALARDCGEIEQFKPGHCWRSGSGDYALWYAPTWRNGVLPTAPCDYTALREASGPAPKSTVLLRAEIRQNFDRASVAMHASRRAQLKPIEKPRWNRISGAGSSAPSSGG